MKAIIDFEHTYAMLTLSLEPHELVKVERLAMVTLEEVSMRACIGGSGRLGQAR